MSETVVAFARRYLCRSETVVAFAGAGRALTETAIAFAGAKWAFLVRFSAAVVLPVSMVAVWGRALVMVVSCWPEPVAAEVSLVSKSPWAGVLSAKKFALLAHNTPNSAFLRLPGEVFRGNVAGGPLLGEYFHGPAVVGLVAGPFYWQC